MRTFFQALGLIIILGISFHVAYSRATDDSAIDIIKCGTFQSEDFKKNLTASLCKVEESRPSLQMHTPSPSGRFVIHYDTTGRNAVAQIDVNGNGIPDYVDSTAYYFDYVYLVEIDSMGYATVQPDGNLGGSDAYDIYLLDLGNGYIGSTFYGYTSRDERIFPERKFFCYTSHIVIDNDFSPVDSTLLTVGTKVQTFTETGVNALKIVAAHEFHHAIQFVYGETSNPSTRLLNEMTSTWMEIRLFPETTDYLQHVVSLFQDFSRYPFGVSDGIGYGGYKWSIFGQYVYKNHGDSLLRRMWELISDGVGGYLALDSAFKEIGSSLVEDWCGFLPWLYYTGSRAIKDSCFPQAAIFPMVKPYFENIWTAPSCIMTNALKSFEVRAFRIHLPSAVATATRDTFDLFLANTDVKSAVMQSQDVDRSYEIAITASPEAGSEQISNTDYYYKLSAPEADICDVKFFNSGARLISWAYPNPFITNKHKSIHFPVPQEAKIDDKVLLEVFNSEMLGIYSEYLIVTADNLFRTVVWSDIPGDISSGVYIYSVTYKESKAIGKFVVLKK